MTVSIEKARAFLDARKKIAEQALDRQYAEACRDFEAIKNMIVERYRPLRLYQWGSLLDRSKFRDYSDIDIAVEGVNAPERFFQMYGEAERLTKWSLHLIDIGKTAPEFADIIKQRGVKVYER